MSAVNFRKCGYRRSRFSLARDVYVRVPVSVSALNSRSESLAVEQPDATYLASETQEGTVHFRDTSDFDAPENCSRRFAHRIARSLTRARE